MKKELHPKYDKTIIECACGNKIETRSTGQDLIKIELCSACHPFFTGKQKFVDTAGRVDKFRARMEAAQNKTKDQVEPTKEEKTEEEKRSNKETLKEIKEQISEAPIAVTQKTDSATELAAEEELKNEQ